MRKTVRGSCSGRWQIDISAFSKFILSTYSEQERLKTLFDLSLRYLKGHGR